MRIQRLDVRLYASVEDAFSLLLKFMKAPYTFKKSDPVTTIHQIFFHIHSGPTLSLLEIPHAKYRTATPWGSDLVHVK
jgi:hypothetical protein